MLRLDPATDSSWPNGWALDDDTTDWMFSLIANRLAQPIPDSVSANDKAFLPNMPWAALPWRPSEG